MATNVRLDEDSNGIDVDQTMYRGMIGSLLYLTASNSILLLVLVYVLDFNQTQKNHII